MYPTGTYCDNILNQYIVHMQLTLVCAYDSNIYTTDTTVTTTETSNGVCKESYAYKTDTAKVFYFNSIYPVLSYEN